MIDLENIKLHLGCGDRKLEGFVNIDNRKECEPDLVLDIGIDRFPYPDGTVSEIVSNHAMEHFPNFKGVVWDMGRVSKDGAIWVIEVPYLTTTLHNLANPYHVNQFSENTFRFWGDLYEREAPSFFKLEILETHFDYNTDLWGEDNDWDELRAKYLNVVTSMTQKIKVHKC